MSDPLPYQKKKFKKKNTRMKNNNEEQNETNTAEKERIRGNKK